MRIEQLAGTAARSTPGEGRNNNGYLSTACRRTTLASCEAGYVLACRTAFLRGVFFLLRDTDYEPAILIGVSHTEVSDSSPIPRDSSGLWCEIVVRLFLIRCLSS